MGDARPCASCNSPIPSDAAFCPACGAASAAQVLAETLVGVGRGAATSATSYELAPDRLQTALGASYELGRLIGRGGFAEVFAVRDIRLKRELALKVLRPDLILSESLVERFRREAEAVAAIQSVHIVPVYDVGEADGICWLIMPLVQGETLKSILAREGRLPVEEVRRILLETAEGLQAAHDAGVVHRDIKPENLMLEGKSGRVLIMDFGIAKAMDASVDHGLTGTGVVIGTPQYMSPEQAMGRKAPDPRSDQYALAAVGYQALTGRVPFAGENVREVMARQLLEEPVPLSRIVPDIPVSVSATLHQALRKDPKQRFESMEAFTRSLRGEAGTGTAGGATGRKTDFKIPVRRRPWLQASGWVLLLVAAGLGARQAGWLEPGAPAPSPTPPPLSPPVQPAPIPHDNGPGRPVNRRAATAVRPDSVAVPPVAAVPLATCDAAVAAEAWPSAVSYCRSEADTSAAARRELGLLYAAGHGVEHNERLAAVHLEMAAQDFDTVAIMEMARRFDTGTGVPVDQAKATGKYDLAANLGVVSAYAVFARRLDEGTGVRADPKKAAVWYEKARKAGDLPSLTRLAALYAEGRGVRKDEDRARELYTEAAERRDAEAEWQMAWMLLNGKRGMEKNEEKGRGWLQRAARQGHPEAVKEMARRKW